jgi:hypothetical protein
VNTLWIALALFVGWALVALTVILCAVNAGRADDAAALMASAEDDGRRAA